MEVSSQEWWRCLYFKLDNIRSGIILSIDSLLPALFWWGNVVQNRQRVLRSRFDDPVIRRIVLVFRKWALFCYTEVQYSEVEYTWTRADVVRVSAKAFQFEPANFLIILSRVLILMTTVLDVLLKRLCAIKCHYQVSGERIIIQKIVIEVDLRPSICLFIV